MTLTRRSLLAAPLVLAFGAMFLRKILEKVS